VAFTHTKKVDKMSFIIAMIRIRVRIRSQTLASGSATLQFKVSVLLINCTFAAVSFYIFLRIITNFTSSFSLYSEDKVNHFKGNAKSCEKKFVPTHPHLASPALACCIFVCVFTNMSKATHLLFLSTIFLQTHIS
jgi:hypothetical protein